MEDDIREQVSNELAEWSTSANDAIHMNLLRNGSKVFDEDFNPHFTFAIFGDEETIPGYKGLTVRIDFRAHDLKPCARIKFRQKMEPFNDEMTELMDIEGKLAEFLPEDAWKAEEGAKNGTNTTAGWTPPGRQLRKYGVAGRQFEVWVSPLADPKAMEIMTNMRILAPFLIEGGTTGFLDEVDWSIGRWKLFLLYEVSGAEYTLAGFSTSYRTWVLPSGDAEELAKISKTLPSATSFSDEQSDMPAHIASSDLLSRERIAQFIILPPFQGLSHGSWLYNAMTELFRSDPHVFEISVEEPNEAFDVLRDMNDMAYLVSQTPFKSLSLASDVPASDLRRTAYIPDFLPAATLLELRAQSKIAARQFQRLTEIHSLSTIPPHNRNTARIVRKSASKDENDRRYYYWRLMVKERLLIRNKDSLMQVEESERVTHLEQTMTGVLDEYTERIEQFERRGRLGLLKIVEAFYGSSASKGKHANGSKGAGKAGPSSSGNVGKKRKVILEDDEDEDDNVSTPAAKRLMSEDAR